MDCEQINIESAKENSGPLYQALKVIQKPNLHHMGQDYNVQKAIFINDAEALMSIQGHPNIVKLIKVIPNGYVESTANNHHKLHIDYAMVIQCLKGGELSFNMY